MSLKEGVRFRKLVDKLSNEEVNLFLTELVNNSPNLLISSIFFLFQSEIIDIAFTKKSKINDKISSIINSRNKDDKKTKDIDVTATNKLKLAGIPDPIIGLSASYLSQADYFNLSKVNRRIFIACNSPNSLQEIYFHYQNHNYHPFNSNLYPNAKHLDFDLYQIGHRTDELINSTFLNQLESITFDGSRCKEECVLFSLEDLPICRNINKLYFNYWIRPNIYCSYITFKNILSKFPKVAYLQLKSVENVELDSIKLLFPNLKGLSIAAAYNENVMKYKQLLYDHTIMSQLEYLELNHINFNHTIECNKLEQLRLSYCFGETMECIVKNATNLKQISISFLNYSKSINTSWNSLVTLIKNCPLLRYISLYHTRELNMIYSLKGIEKSLNKTKHIQRKYIKLRIEMRGNAHDPFNLISSVASLVNQIKSNKFNDFMFIWEMEIDAKSAEKISLKLGMNSFVTNGMHSFSQLVVIQNEGCKMNGFSESWKM